MPETERLLQAYLAGLAAIDRRRVALAAQIAQIDLMTRNGRYDFDLAENSELFGSAASRPAPVVLQAPKRGRGRPRTYGPGDVRPPRPTRAKTAAGLARAMLGTAVGRKRKNP